MITSVFSNIQWRFAGKGSWVACFPLNDFDHMLFTLKDRGDGSFYLLISRAPHHSRRPDLEYLLDEDIVVGLGEVADKCWSYIHAVAGEYRLE